MADSVEQKATYKQGWRGNHMSQHMYPRRPFCVIRPSVSSLPSPPYPPIHVILLFMKGNIPHTVSTLKEMLLRLARLYIDNVKLTVAEKLTIVFSAATLMLTLLVLGIFALAFLSGAIVSALALLFPQWACYLICFGFFVVLILAIVLLRKAIIVNPIARFVSRLVFEHGQENNSNKA